MTKRSTSWWRALRQWASASGQAFRRQRWSCCCKRYYRPAFEQLEDRVVFSATKFAFTGLPSAVAEGASYNVTVTAEDSNGTQDTSYAGTVHFRITDGISFAPADSPLSGGRGVFQFIFREAGNIQLIATDTVHSNITSSFALPMVPTYFSVNAPQSVTAGTTITAMISATDGLGNIVANFADALTLTYQDPVASFPTNLSLTGGQASVKVICRSAGRYLLSATDELTDTIIQGSAFITVVAGPPAYVNFNLPAHVTAGVPFQFQAQAVDINGNVTNAGSAIAQFTSSDSLAVLPSSNSTDLGAGPKVLIATLKTAGTQTLTAALQGANNPTIESNSTLVAAATPAALAFSGIPLTLPPGKAANFKVAMVDAYGNPVILQTSPDSLHFASSDGSAQLPVNAALANGASGASASCTVTFSTPGNQTLTVTDGSYGFTATSAPISVTSQAVTHFALTGLPTPSITAGSSFMLTVTAQDQSGNTEPAYAGTVQITSTDSFAQPFLIAFGHITLTNGIGHFSVTLYTAGSQSVTATDIVNSSFTSTSSAVVVVASLPSVFAMTVPSTTAPAIPFNVTVRVHDNYNNTVLNYGGTIHFTKSDSANGSAVPADYTFVAADSGQHVFFNGATLISAGNQTISAADTLTGTSGFRTIAVSAGAASHYTISGAPASVTAGAPFPITVTAQDQAGNTDSTFTGSVHLTTTSPVATTFGLDGTITNGLGVLSVTLYAAGSQALTAINPAVGFGSWNGTSSTINVFASAATHLVVATVGSTSPNTAFKVTVSAEDSFGNIAANYLGTVHFSKSDSANGSDVPADYTFVAADSGQHMFNSGATFISAGNQTLTATDTVSGINGSASISVSVAAANHYTISGAPTTVTAGAPFALTVTAQDQAGNTDSTFNGPVLLNCTDGLLINAGLITNGLGLFSVSILTAGSQRVFAENTAANVSWTGTSGAINVLASAASHFVVATVGSTLPNTPFNITVVAEDPSGNVNPNYLGTVHFTKSDASNGSVIPVDYTFVAADSGQHVFSNGATLVTAGNQKITATDKSNASITGSSTVGVQASPVTFLQILNTPTEIAPGTLFTLTVVAYDSPLHPDFNYNGRVHFTSTDANASLPGGPILSGGEAFLSATLMTPGVQTVTVADAGSSSISGSVTITVNANGATHFAFSGLPTSIAAGVPFAFTVTALGQSGNTDTAYAGAVGVTSNGGLQVLGASIPPGGVGTFTATLLTAGNQSLTATDNKIASITGLSSTVTVTAGVLTQFALTGIPASVGQGVPFELTAVAEDVGGNTVTGYNGTVHFSSSDGQAVLPADATLTSGKGIFNATLQTLASQTLTATDTITSSVTGSSNPIAVATAPTALIISVPNSQAAGSPFSFDVTAVDASANPTAGYNGTIHFTSSDPEAVLAADVTLTNGTGSFTATLSTAGNQTLTATDTVSGSFSGTSVPIAISAGAATQLDFSGTPAHILPGTPFHFTVSAEDQFGNTDPTYTSNLVFTSGDSAATLPSSSSNFTGGTGIYSATLQTPGSQTLMVSDGVLNTAFSPAIFVGATATTHFAVSAPSSTGSGNAFIFMVTALDQFNTTVTNYSGPIHFTSSDNQAGLPVDSTLTAGVGIFGAVLETGGNQTLIVADAANSSITGTATVNAAAAPATHFTISTPASTFAGSLFQFTVTALDQGGRTATGYSGKVHFTTTANQGAVPVDTTLVNGTGIFNAVLVAAGNESLTAADTLSTGITGSTIVSVLAGPAVTFAVNAPGSTNAGTALVATITALDLFHNTAPTYSGTVHFTSSDRLATLPPDGTLSNGVGHFATTLMTGGNQTLTATDTIAGGLGGNIAISVIATAATHFSISAPTKANAGNVFVVIVTALDQSGGTAFGYAGTIHFASTDAQAILPADGTLSGGLGFFGASFRTAGTETISASDAVTSSIAGTSNNVSIAALAASHFAVSAPVSAITGNPINVTVKALDPFNNAVAGYTGTVHFSSTDAAAGLPADYPFTAADAGTHLVSGVVTLKTPGSTTIGVIDTLAPGITGTTAAISTRGLIITSLIPTATGFTAVFNKPFVATRLNLYDQGTQSGFSFGPADVLLTGPSSPQISFRGSLLIDASNTTITFVKTSSFTGVAFNPSTGVLAAGTYTVTMRSASNGFVDVLGDPLDGANNGDPAGSNYTATFVVGATPVVVGIPSFARGPDSVDAVNLPNNAALGIPLNLSVGSGVTSGKFTLTYNSALLSISAASANSLLASASLSLDAASSAGKAIIDFSSPTALTASGAVRLGSLAATVPNAAAAFYKSKALLHWSGTQLNGGAIPVIGDDAVQVVAYLGDVTGDGQLSGSDAAAISAVATVLFTNTGTGTLSGFSAYQLADPAIIGDVNSNGNTDASDTTLINTFLAGTPRPQIPALPIGLTIVPVGPDPSLSLPTTLQTMPGGTLVVPVNIDTAHPDGSSGATEAILALTYNPHIFTVSASDVELGSLTSGWQLSAAVDAQTGEIGIDLWSITPIQTTAGGSLVTIIMHVRDGGQSGLTDLMLVNQVNPMAQRVFRTEVADAQGAFVLHGAATVQGIEPDQPGQVTVSHGPPLMTGHVETGSLPLTVALREESVAYDEFNQMAAVAEMGTGGTPYAQVADLVFRELAMTDQIPITLGGQTDAALAGELEVQALVKEKRELSALAFGQGENGVSSYFEDCP